MLAPCAFMNASCSLPKAVYWSKSKIPINRVDKSVSPVISLIVSFVVGGWFCGAHTKISRKTQSMIATANVQSPREPKSNPFLGFGCSNTKC